MYSKTLIFISAKLDFKIFIRGAWPGDLNINLEVVVLLTSLSYNRCGLLMGFYCITRFHIFSPRSRNVVWHVWHFFLNFRTLPRRFHPRIWLLWNTRWPFFIPSGIFRYSNIKNRLWVKLRFHLIDENRRFFPFWFTHNIPLSLNEVFLLWKCFQNIL